MNEDELLARLRAVDPALARRAPAPDIDRLLETVMATTDVHTQTSQPSRWQPRLLAAAAAGLIATGGFITWQATHTTASHPSAAPLALTVQHTDEATRCAAPTVDILRSNTTAFEGTVTSVSGGKVTFRVTHRYRGDDLSGGVTMKQSMRLEDLTFAPGERYLVVARKGAVKPCGGTVGAEPDMRRLYRQAFESER
ncbi:hypothetical protein JCM4814A_02340 [Streptomyces phaeofaciens JCM 4814]|uniref:Uncharacterized protein n=1 Tax=Streptomyces phaeofaciens TaxID=68254 RepID=A0A918HR52_9ACTN|nr:hypothetical protein [Streptomyces phaeofaciens]GGT93223.1 hypothetical protein GCM10010226_83890 [Streptomyces phaeofaciens]